MKVASPGTDLLLFGRVLAHPRRQWSSWHTLVRDLFAAGGVTITTPPAEGNEPIYAKTVIQPDGDVLVLVHGAHVTDADVLATHQQRVSQWYVQARTTVHQVVATLRVMVWTVSVAAAATFDSITAAAVRWQVGLLVAGVFLPVARWLLGRLAKNLLKARIDRVLHGAGVVG